jgi:hypothetical protein
MSTAGLFSSSFMGGQKHDPDDLDDEGEGEGFDRQWQSGALEYNKTRIHRSTKLKRRELALVEVCETPSTSSLLQPAT